MKRYTQNRFQQSEAGTYLLHSDNVMPQEYIKSESCNDDLRATAEQFKNEREDSNLSPDYKKEDSDKTAEQQSTDDIDTTRDTKPTQFTCSACHRSFIRLTWIVKHIKLCHSKGSAQVLVNGQLATEQSTQQTKSSRPCCTHCNKYLASSQLLNIHMLMHMGEMPFSCSACHYPFVNMPALRKHISLLHAGNAHVLKNGNMFDPSRVVKPLCTDEIIVPGKDSQHGPNPFKRRKHSLTINASFRCEVCNKSFPSWGHLRCHTFEHKSKKIFSCSACKQNFGLKGNAQHHVRRFHAGKAHVLMNGKVTSYRPRKPFPVSDSIDSCLTVSPAETVDENTTTDYQLDVSTSQSMTYNLLPPLDSILDMSCEESGEVYVHEHLSHTLINIHKGTMSKTKLPRTDISPEVDESGGKVEELSVTKRPRCSHCNKYFASKQLLRVHILMHMGEKPFACSACHYPFVNMRALRKHISLLHAGNAHVLRNGHMFDRNRMRNLRGTDEIVVPGEDSCDGSNPFKRDKKLPAINETFQCDFCNKCFPSWGRLNRHKWAHKSKKIFSCSACNHRFGLKANARHHVKRFHAGKAHVLMNGNLTSYRPRKCLSITHSSKEMNGDDRKFECKLCSRDFPTFVAFSEHNCSQTKCIQDHASKQSRKVTVRNSGNDGLCSPISAAIGNSVLGISEPGYIVGKIADSCLTVTSAETVDENTTTENELDGSTSKSMTNDLRPPPTSILDMSCEESGNDGIHEHLSSKPAISGKGTRSHSERLKRCCQIVSSRQNACEPVTKESSVTRYQCYQCRKYLASNQLLRIHILIHRGEKPFACSACLCPFVNVVSLRKHISQLHDGNAHVLRNGNIFDPNRLAKPLGTDEIIVPGKDYLHGSNPFKRRQHLPTLNVCYLCKVCNKSFRYKGLLNCHACIHKSIKKQFSSSTSQTNFHERGNVQHCVKRRHAGKAHLQMNGKLESYQQRTPPSVSDTSKNTNGDDGKFCCKLCDKSFPSFVDFNMHNCYLTRAKEDGGQYFCSECKLTCRLSHIETHIAEMHVNNASIGDTSRDGRYSPKSTMSTNSDANNVEKIADSCSTVLAAETVDENITTEDQLDVSTMTNSLLLSSDSILDMSCEESGEDDIHENLSYTHGPRTNTDQGTRSHSERLKRRCRNMSSEGNACEPVNKESTDSRRHKCSQCNKYLSSKQRLNGHMLMHMGEKPFACSECHFPFVNMLALKNHIRQLHAGNAHVLKNVNICYHKRCNINKTLGKTPVSTAQLHGSLCPNDEPEHEIEQWTESRRGIHPQQHLSHHPNDEQSSCLLNRRQRRRQKGKMWLKLKKHYSRVGRRYQCSQCSKYYFHKQLLKGHKLVHLGETHFACSACQRPYVSIRSLRSHINLYHEGNGHVLRNGNIMDHRRLILPLGTDEIVFVNKDDPNTTNPFRRQEVTRLLPAADGMFHCTVCNKAFAQEQNLARHTQRHNKEKPFACSICHRHFTEKGNARYHIRLHHAGMAHVLVNANLGRRPQPEHLDELVDRRITPNSWKIFQYKPVKYPTEDDRKCLTNFLYSCSMCPRVFVKFARAKKHNIGMHHGKASIVKAGNHICDSPETVRNNDVVSASLTPNDVPTHQQILPSSDPTVSSAATISLNSSTIHLEYSTLAEANYSVTPTCNVITSPTDLGYHESDNNMQLCKNMSYRNDLINVVYETLDSILTKINRSEPQSVNLIAFNRNQRPLGQLSCELNDSSKMPPCQEVKQLDRNDTKEQTEEDRLRQQETGAQAVATEEGRQGKEYRCSECNKILKTRDSLKAHFRSHLIEAPFACSACLLPFISRIYLEKHINRRHPGTAHVLRNGRLGDVDQLCLVDLGSDEIVIVNDDDPNARNPFKRLRRQKELHAVGADGRFHCHFCKKTFQQVERLNHHMRIHNAEKMFACSVCKKPFGEKGNTWTHIMRHHAGKAHVLVNGKYMNNGVKPREADEVVYDGDLEIFCVKRNTLIGDNKSAIVNVSKKSFSGNVGKKSVSRNVRANASKKSVNENVSCNVSSKPVNGNADNIFLPVETPPSSTATKYDTGTTSDTNLNPQNLDNHNFTSQSPKGSGAVVNHGITLLLSQQMEIPAGDEAKRFTCSVCSHSYIYLAILKRHIAKIHNGQAKVVKDIQNRGNVMTVDTGVKPQSESIDDMCVDMLSVAVSSQGGTDDSTIVGHSSIDDDNDINTDMTIEGDFDRDAELYAEHGISRHIHTALPDSVDKLVNKQKQPCENRYVVSQSSKKLDIGRSAFDVLSSALQSLFTTLVASDSNSTVQTTSQDIRTHNRQLTRRHVGCQTTDVQLEPVADSFDKSNVPCENVPHSQNVMNAISEIYSDNSIVVHCQNTLLTSRAVLQRLRNTLSGVLPSATGVDSSELPHESENISRPNDVLIGNNDARSCENLSYSDDNTENNVDPNSADGDASVVYSAISSSPLTQLASAAVHNECIDPCDTRINPCDTSSYHCGMNISRCDTSTNPCVSCSSTCDASVDPCNMRSNLSGGNSINLCENSTNSGEEASNGSVGLKVPGKQPRKRRKTFWSSETASESMKLLCSDCGKVCLGTVRLNTHRQAAHCEQLPDLCPHCGLYVKSLSTHIKSVHRTHNTKLTCNVCAAQFNKKHQLTTHLLTHSTPHQTTLPPLSHYQNWTDLNDNSCRQELCNNNVDDQLVDVSDSFYCVDCGDSFSEKCSMISHAMQCHGDSRGLYRCNHCDEMFEWKIELSWHMRLQHSEILDTLDSFYVESDCLMSL